MFSILEENSLLSKFLSICNFTYLPSCQDNKDVFELQNGVALNEKEPTTDLEWLLKIRIQLFSLFLILSSTDLELLLSLSVKVFEGKNVDKKINVTDEIISSDNDDTIKNDNIDKNNESNNNKKDSHHNDEFKNQNKIEIESKTQSAWLLSFTFCVILADFSHFSLSSYRTLSTSTSTSLQNLAVKINGKVFFPNLFDRINNLLNFPLNRNFLLNLFIIDLNEETLRNQEINEINE